MHDLNLSSKTALEEMTSLWLETIAPNLLPVGLDSK
jgi:hypothetical protein